MKAKDLRKRLLSKKLISLGSVLLLLALVLGSSTTAFSQEVGGGGIVRMVIARGSIRWVPLVEHGGIELTVSGPGDMVYGATFGPDAVPRFRLADASGDGFYRYELRVLSVDDGAARPKVDDAQRGLVEVGGEEAIVLSGGFTIRDGRFVTQVEESEAEDAPNAPDASLAPSDILHYDDVIITGSLCVGFDCVNGESFGYCTQKYKENNLQVCFEDTSLGTFPTNDWKIQINDTTSGGASYFTLWDLDGGRRPFTIEAGAPAHSLYVEDYGRVGLGTSIPYVELHIADGDSPTIRLDQDGSSGWTAQSWDMCGNETNFFIRDVTNGSKLPFRIQPNTPSNTLNLRSTGYVGIGTWSPESPLELETTGENAIFTLERTSGAKGKMTAAFNRIQFGSVTNHDLELVVYGLPKATLDTNGDLSLDTGGEMNAAAFNITSDVNAKENFAPVDGKEVLTQLEGVEITTWSFKGDDVRHIGPTAQEFYAAYGLGADDKHISTTDADGVALAAIKELNAQNGALEAKNAALEARLTALEQAAGSSPEPQVSFLSLLPWILVGVLLVGIGALGGFVLAMHKQLGRAKS